METHFEVRDAGRRPLRRAAGIVAALALLTISAVAQDPEDDGRRVTTWPDGTPRERYTVDDEERKHGKFEAWAENGALVHEAAFQHGLRQGVEREWSDDGTLLRTQTFQKDVLHGASKTFDADGAPRSSGSYRKGQRHGKWTDVDAATGRTRSTSYREGLLHGKVRVEADRRVLSRQTWKNGELVELDGLAPFPVAAADLLEALRAILATPHRPDPADAKSALRHAALQRLRAYRHLCGLRHDDLELIAEWNDLCDAASEVCRKNGALDHFPTQPPGFDDARYRQAQVGARSSNLGRGGQLVDSVDSYMDDSDPSNIARVGHRRWCLNPSLKRLGFGTDGSFHAMWSMDGSGKPARGLPGVYYPPRGHVPVDLFAAHHAFSIGLVRGGAPRVDELQVAIRPLDADWVAGAALAIDAVHVGDAGQGTGPCIIFRAKGLKVQRDERYLVEVSFDGGRSLEHRYLVAFCEPVVGAK